MAAAPFDTLKLARALRDKAGFTQEHAEATADALAEVVVGQVATKQDVGDARAEIAALRTDVRAEIAALRAEVHAEIAALRAEMTAGFRDVEQRITIRLGGMLVVMTGILLAAKFLG
jgi:hypothetical protein